MSFSLSLHTILNEDGVLKYFAVVSPTIIPTDCEKILSMVDFGIELKPQYFSIRFKRVYSVAEQKLIDEQTDFHIAQMLYLGQGKIFCLLDVSEVERESRRLEFNSKLIQHGFHPIY